MPTNTFYENLFSSLTSTQSVAGLLASQYVRPTLLSNNQSIIHDLHGRNLKGMFVID